ncbi:PEPxxWA-CTERM sorting domain-containing protein [Sphingomonas flavalba]|uniref:PEPxxWA-CTERM sorting domain-containing protein n=1 Tax=Sphingomonas flavalba TaxID=2559804 RepID=UPI00109DFC9A|nr:PEPxxWA-CTERM sorting domain-containing protein [Sphingomonas flavalba]
MFGKLALTAAAAVTFIGLSSPASALTLGATNCALSDIGSALAGTEAIACRGWYDNNNLNGNSEAKRKDSAAALNALFNTTTFDWQTLSWIDEFDVGGNVINFATPLFGQTVLAIHVGAAKGEPNGVGYTSTAFFIFDAGNLPGGLTSLDFNRAGLSNVRVYSTGTYTPPTNAVPEPATWAMLIAGFGLAGVAARRRRRTGVSFA